MSRRRTERQRNQQEAEQLSPYRSSGPVGKRSTVEVSQKRTFYPLAEDLEAYNRAIPDGAQRLFTVFEKQSDHRMALEAKVLGSQQRQAVIGQVLGFVALLVCVGFAVWCAALGMEWLAGTIVTVTLGGGFTVFITGKGKQKKDLEKKRQSTEEAPPP